MSRTRKTPIAFDVLGTCFSFEPAIEALQQLLGADSITEAHARSIIDDWFHTSQRDFTYLSMNGAYTPIGPILKATLPRILLMNQLTTSLTSHDLSPILSIIPKLPARSSLVECTSLLLSSTSPKFHLLAATNGADATTRGLFRAALGEPDAEKWDYFSCDTEKMAKPAPEVYEAVWKHLGIGKEKNHDAWFVASHTWDLFAAKKAGFRTAWVSYEERSHLPEIWGEPDIIASDLVDAAKQIIARESEREKVEFM